MITIVMVGRFRASKSRVYIVPSDFLSTRLQNIIVWFHLNALSTMSREAVNLKVYK